MLPATVSPRVRAMDDRGEAAQNQPAGRMLLMLSRPADREAALQKYLADVHTEGSAEFHHWLTPEQFGQRFGASDADIQVLSQWLSEQGLQVTRVAYGRQFVEFTGTVGQVNATFHTTIHEYAAKDAAVTRYANATDLQIPTALSGLIRGIVPLNNFRAAPQVVVRGKATYDRATKRATPDWTIPNPFGTSNPNVYAMAPEDWATQYDIAPLYKAGVTGAGQTIGIINESNIDLSLVQAYQKLFGLTGPQPQVVIDGLDPGEIAGVDTEAYLDVELAGAIAPQANVLLYIASAGTLIDPLELAAVRAVEDNQASVLSVSFGSCEYWQTTSGNQFWESLWQQAAAQGQTVLVSSGDTGPACDGIQPSVNALASTPWDVAVGGTDFYYSDYATGGASADTLWNGTNDAHLGSLKAPLPEQGWSDAFGLNVIADGWERGQIAAGGGGPSSCVTQATGGGCGAGYPKPDWQKGKGVTADGVRDLPDVSLFASNGANLSAVPVCGAVGECAANADSTELLLIGGTSASAPAMAGIMALVNQKLGRQGQVNNLLYPLAQQKPEAFHDIALGGNQTACVLFYWGKCTTEPNGHGATPVYLAGAGYDMATGLGSVDANALVTDWNSLAFKGTTTTLQVSNTSVTHGTPLSLTATVTSPGSLPPTGAVSILSNAGLPNSASLTSLPLTLGTGKATVNYLPGGDYQLTARYGGDGQYAASTSSPVAVKIAAEPSNANMLLTSGGQVLNRNNVQVQYNQPFQVNLQPLGMNSSSTNPGGIATGTATFTLDSTTVMVPLNAAGIASWVPPALGPGTHTVSGSYSGDASYQASTAPAMQFTVNKGPLWINGDLYGPLTFEQNSPYWYMAPGSSLTFGVTVQPHWSLGASPSQIPLGTVAPTGTVTLCLTQNPNVGGGACPTPTYTMTVPLTQAIGPNSIQANAVGTFKNIAAGQYMVEAQYNGDANYEPYGLFIVNWINVGPLPPLTATKTSLTVSPTSLSGNDKATVTATVTRTDNGGTTPTGIVWFYSDGQLLYGISLPKAAVGNSSSVTFQPTAAWFWNSGANDITATYEGDGATFGPSQSETVSLTATRTTATDFTIASANPQINVKSGGTATATLNLAPLSGLNETVNLSCATSSTQFSCTMASGSMALSGASTTSVNITAKIPGGQGATASRVPGWPAGVLAVCCILGLARKRRALGRWGVLAVLTACVVAGLNGCGGGGGSGGGGGGGGNSDNTPAGLYSVVVTASSGTVVHNVRISVVVQ